MNLFHLMCPSVVGGLPLAEILTTREDTGTILFALELLKSVLPPGAFYELVALHPQHYIRYTNKVSHWNQLYELWENLSIFNSQR